jgi:hypothetical protein
VQPVGLHGPVSGVPTRPAYVIPHKDLSGAGRAVVRHLSEGKGR